MQLLFNFNYKNVVKLKTEIENLDEFSHALMSIGIAEKHAETSSP